MKLIIIMILILMPFSLMAKFEFLENNYGSKENCDEDKRRCQDLQGFTALDCNEGKVPKYHAFNSEMLINVEEQILLRPEVQKFN